MNNRLQSLIEEHKLISNCQIGFRKGKHKINLLMYADDTLLMSKSKKGLDKAQIFCRKWQLAIINTDKTKIMTFNKSKYMDGPFYLNGHPLEKVHTYNYLGLKINNNGSFTIAIK